MWWCLEWQVLKDGMQHVGKLMCSRMGARMDSEPKRWRIFADLMYDIGAGLEVISPLCPQQFLPVAGMANLAKVCSVFSVPSLLLLLWRRFWRNLVWVFVLVCVCRAWRLSLPEPPDYLCTPLLLKRVIWVIFMPRAKRYQHCLTCWVSVSAFTWRQILLHPFKERWVPSDAVMFTSVCFCCYSVLVSAFRLILWGKLIRIFGFPCDSLYGLQYCQPSIYIVYNKRCEQLPSIH